MGSIVFPVGRTLLHYRLTPLPQENIFGPFSNIFTVLSEEIREIFVFVTSTLLKTRLGLGSLRFERLLAHYCGWDVVSSSRSLLSYCHCFCCYLKFSFHFITFVSLVFQSSLQCHHCSLLCRSYIVPQFPPPRLLVQKLLV